MAPAVFQSPYFLTAASLEKLDAQINKETIEKFLSKNPTDSSLGGQTSAVNSDTICATLTIQFRDQTAKERVVPISRIREVSIGRHRSCDVQMDHPAMSRIHVRFHTVHISDEYDSLCYMTDSSTNGTILRSASPAFRKSIVKGQDVLLSDGDSIEIPNVCIVTFKQTMRGVQLSEEVQRARREFALGEWQLSNRLLGSGSFATVLMAVSKKDIAKQIACKIIDRARIERLAAPTGSWHREVEVLRLISHPNTIHAEHVLVAESFVFIMTALVSGGDLFSHVYSGKFHGRYRVPDAERQLAWIVYQLLYALYYLHSCGIVHRDLKLENILVADSAPYSRVLLTDFGMSKYGFIAPTANMTSRELPRIRMQSFCGTITYQAPEILDIKQQATDAPRTDQDHGYGPEVDLWSLGCLSHEMLLGRTAFGMLPTDSDEEIYQKIAESQARMQNDLSSEMNLSPEAKSFLQHLLVCNPRSRLSIREAFHHAWIARYRAAFVTMYKEKVWAGWKQKIPVVKRSDTIPELIRRQSGDAAQLDGPAGESLFGNVPKAQEADVVMNEAAGTVHRLLPSTVYEQESPYREPVNMAIEPGSRNKRPRRSIEISPISI